MQCWMLSSMWGFDFIVLGTKQSKVVCQGMRLYQVICIRSGRDYMVLTLVLLYVGDLTLILIEARTLFQVSWFSSILRTMWVFLWIVWKTFAFCLSNCSCLLRKTQWEGKNIIEEIQISFCILVEVRKRNISMSKSYIVSNQGEQFGYQSLSVIGSCCCSFFNVKIEECEDEFILVLP